MTRDRELIGYFAARCPNGNENPHVFPVLLSSGPNVTVTVTEMPYGPETRTEYCADCWRHQQDSA